MDELLSLREDYEAESEEGATNIREEAAAQEGEDKEAKEEKGTKHGVGARIDEPTTGDVSRAITHKRPQFIGASSSKGCKKKSGSISDPAMMTAMGEAQTQEATIQVQEVTIQVQEATIQAQEVTI